MIRIVLIGNGFDLAHGLKTGYIDLLDYLTTQIGDKPARALNKHGFSDPLFDIYDYVNKTVEQYRRILINKKDKENTKLHVGTRYGLLTGSKRNVENYSILLHSLFEHYNDNCNDILNWSNLEALYYTLLCEYKNSPEHISLINQEFDYLKYLLEEYLTVQEEKCSVVEGIDLMISNRYQGMGSKPFPEDSPMLHIINHFNSKVEKTGKISDSYYINFNYTSTLEKYFNNYDYMYNNPNKLIRKGFPPGIQVPELQCDEIIYIHGQLNNSEKPIIFGYGDENADEYKELELVGNNEVLKNFKTFQYLRSNSYKQVLGLLESDEEIYVQLIGHSCGLCDKALLRTIFQHKNVKYIEATYYQDESKYFENLYNISRIFDDNTLMREKVLPLEQTRKIG